MYVWGWKLIATSGDSCDQTWIICVLTGNTKTDVVFESLRDIEDPPITSK